MSRNLLYSHCIKRAAELLGGFDNLGAHIGVDPQDLARWASGAGAPSDAIFLKIVDIVLDKQLGTPRSSALQTSGKPAP
jgi:hypothetical protein